jgi:hypothetical protein
MATFVKVQTLDADNAWAKNVLRYLNLDQIWWVDSETNNRLAVRTSDGEPKVSLGPNVTTWSVAALSFLVAPHLMVAALSLMHSHRKSA